MLDPRIYRTGLVAVALAVIVFAFSFEDQPAGPRTSLAPDAFNGANAAATLLGLTQRYPNRLPGSAGDQGVADVVAARLKSNGFAVSRTTFTAHTALGKRTLQNVVGTLTGSSNSAIVVVAHRDAMHVPDPAELTGTSVLLELARVLGGETVRHTFVLVSTSGSVGAAGAEQIARQLPEPVDGVLVLGDLGAAHPSDPIVAPWSRGLVLAPPELRNTVTWALGAQAGITPKSSSLTGQLLHLAFPLTLSEQAPFNAAGEPAVFLSLSGERGPDPHEALSGAQISAQGRTALDAVNALDAGAQLPRPSGYLLLDGKVVPAWAVRLLALALIVPVALTSVDGLARARRRRLALRPWVVWVLACALPFLLAAVVVALARLFGALSGAPGGPVPGAAATLHAAGVVTLCLAGVVLLAGLGLLAPWLAGRAGAHPWREGGPESSAAGVIIAAVLSLVGLVMWVVNPFAVLLLVPALHLWMWLGAGQWPIPRPLKLVLTLLGAAAPAAAVLYYGMASLLSPLGILWNGVLMLSTGQIGWVTAVLWSLVFGCFATVLVLALRPSRGRREEPVAITVRGPVSYAGPGSLGGTPSAVRRP